MPERDRLGGGVGGMYPLAYSGETRVSGSARYGVVADSMRMRRAESPPWPV